MARRKTKASPLALVQLALLVVILALNIYTAYEAHLAAWFMSNVEGFVISAPAGHGMAPSSEKVLWPN